MKVAVTKKEAKQVGPDDFDVISKTKVFDDDATIADIKAWASPYHSARGELDKVMLSGFTISDVED